MSVEIGTVSRQAAYHGFGVLAFRGIGKVGSLASIDIHPDNYITAPSKMYRVVSTLPERSGWYWTAPRQLLCWLEHKQ